MTPSVKTDSSGNPTETINAKPSETASSGSGQNNNVVASCDSTKYELEDEGNVQPWIPFCAPHNGTEWWVDGNYYVTWNPKHWAGNSTVKLFLNYADAGGAGKVAKSVCPSSPNPSIERVINPEFSGTAPITSAS